MPSPLDATAALYGLIPLAANTAIQAGKGIYDAIEAPKRRAAQMQLTAHNALLDLLQSRAEKGMGYEDSDLRMTRGLDAARRGLNLTPPGQLPTSTGNSPTFDPTAFLPLVTAGGLTAAAVGAAGSAPTPPIQPTGEMADFEAFNGGTDERDLYNKFKAGGV